MEEEIRRLAEAARASSESGKIDESIISYQKITKLRPEDAESWLTLGELQAQAGSVEDGIESIRESIRLDPGNSYAWLILGYLHHASGNLDEAKRSGLHAVEIEFENADAWLFLSGVAGQLGEIEQAENCAWRAVSLDQNNPNSHTNHGHALLNLGNPGEAETAYWKALELAPTMPEPRLGLISILINTTRLDELSSHIRQLLNADLNSAEILSEIGERALERGNSSGAIALFSNLIASYPEYENGHVWLNKAYLAADSSTEARHS